MIDSDRSDDKIVAAPIPDPHQAEFFDIADIPQHLLLEIADFFRTYKELEGSACKSLVGRRAMSLSARSRDRSDSFESDGQSRVPNVQRRY